MDQLLDSSQAQELVQQHQDRDLERRIVGGGVPGLGVARQEELDQQPHDGRQALQIVRGDGDVERHRFAAEAAEIKVVARRGAVDQGIGPQGELGGQRRLDGAARLLGFVAEAQDVASAQGRERYLLLGEVIQQGLEILPALLLRAQQPVDLPDGDRPAQVGPGLEHQQGQPDHEVPGHVVPIGVVALVGNQDRGDGLHVGDPQVAFAHIGEDVEGVRAAILLEGIEAVDPLPQDPAPVARGQVVVLALDVQADDGPLPVQQVRDHEPDALAGTRGRGKEGMQVAVEGQQPAPVAPEQDRVGAGLVKSGPGDLTGTGQARGAVQRFGR